MKLFGFSFGKKKRDDDDDDDDWEEEDDDGLDGDGDEDEDRGAGTPEDGDAKDSGPAEDDPEAAPEEASTDEAPDDAEADSSDEEDDDDFDDEDDEDDEDGEKSPGIGKGRLIIIGAASLVVLATAGGGAWWFFAGDAPPQPPRSTRAKPGVPRVVIDVPPKIPAPGGGLLTPPVRLVRAPQGAIQGQPAAAGQASPGGDATPGGPVPGGGTPARAAPGSLNAVLTTIREPGAGIVVPAVTQAAFAAIPAAAPAQPLAAVPDPALIEQSPQGPLPKIAADGRMAWRAYARPFEDDGNRPRIAVIIGGLGLSRAATEAAVGLLPGSVTLAFDPYAKGLEDWVSRARQAGHEVLLSLPMEPAAFPLYDPGPLALLTTLEPEANLARLAFVLGQIPGYVGVVSIHGSRFTVEERQIRPVLEFLKQRGLMYVDNGTTKKSLAPGIASEIGLPNTVSNLTLDFDLSRAAIDSRLARLEATARENKAAVAMASPYPVIVERLAAWIGTLDKKGLVLAPVSSLPVMTTKPK